MPVLSAKAYRAIGRRAYLRALAEELAADAGGGAVILHPSEGSEHTARLVRVDNPLAFAAKTEGLALVALIEAMAPDPATRLAAIARASQRTGNWTPLPGDVIDREGDTVLTIAPKGRIGWVVTTAGGPVRYAVRAQADHQFRIRVDRLPKDRPEGVPMGAAYGSLSEED